MPFSSEDLYLLYLALVPQATPTFSMFTLKTWEWPGDEAYTVAPPRATRVLSSAIVSRFKPSQCTFCAYKTQLDDYASVIKTQHAFPRLHNNYFAALVRGQYCMTVLKSQG